MIMISPSYLIALTVGLMSVPGYSEELRVSITDLLAESGLADAVVELQPKEMWSIAVSPVETSVDQVDKEFVSGVTVVPKGSRVSFPNSDDILHHVYSFSPAKTFDIPLYGSDENREHYESFSNSGIVEIGCNIHDWMLAYIYVADSALVAKTDIHGIADFHNLKPGAYSVKIWHSRMGTTEFVTRDIAIGTDEAKVLSVTLDLEPERRIRRAPTSTRNRYR